MNTIDIILLIFLGFGLIRGLIRGIIVELATFLAIILGIYGAIYFSFYVSEELKQYISLNPATMKAFSFGITLIVIMISVMLLAKWLTKVVKSVSLGFLNRLLGGIFGLLKQVVIAGSVFLFLEKTWFIERQRLIPIDLEKKSVLYEPVKKGGELIYNSYFNHLLKSIF